MKLAAAAMIAMIAMLAPTLARAGQSPVVLELFTSQSCSSCPPADALLQTLSNDPSLLPLSFHVDYWDQLDWKDVFSLHASTERQRAYERALQQKNVYTPELVVDGAAGMIGSREGEVRDAIAAARTAPKPIRVAIVTGADGRLAISFAGSVPQTTAKASIWLVAFSPRAVTAVRGGENSGRELTSINNVSAITRLAETGERTLPPLDADKTGDAQTRYAALVQDRLSGRILGAGATD